MNADLRSTLVSAARFTLDTANALISPLDGLFAPRRAEDAGDDAPCLFILGAPRSGTTLTYQVVTRQFEVAYFTGWMNYLYGMPNLVARRTSRRAPRPPAVFESEYGKITGAFSPSESGNFWFRWFPRDGADGNHIPLDCFGESELAGLRRAVSSMIRIHRKPIAFKCVYLTMVVPILAKALPRARFLYLKRDMLWNCQSLILARRRLGFEQRWWSVRPPGYRELANEPLWKQAAEQILRTRRTIERDLRSSARGRYMEIEYEALCDDPRKLVRELGQWLEPCGFRAYSDSDIPDRFSRTSRWALEEKESMVRNYLERSWQSTTS